MSGKSAVMTTAPNAFAQHFAILFNFSLAILSFRSSCSLLLPVLYLPPRYIIPRAAGECLRAASSGLRGEGSRGTGALRLSPPTESPEATSTGRVVTRDRLTGVAHLVVLAPGFGLIVLALGLPLLFSHLRHELLMKIVPARRAVFGHDPVVLALVNKGLTFGRLNRPEDALTICDEVVRRLRNSKFPPDPALTEHALLERARATLAIGDPSGCEQDIEALLALLPELGSLVRLSEDGRILKVQAL